MKSMPVDRTERSQYDLDMIKMYSPLSGISTREGFKSRQSAPRHTVSVTVTPGATSVTPGAQMMANPTQRRAQPLPLKAMMASQRDSIAPGLIGVGTSPYGRSPTDIFMQQAWNTTAVPQTVENFQMWQTFSPADPYFGTRSQTDIALQDQWCPKCVDGKKATTSVFHKRREEHFTDYLRSFEDPENPTSFL
jgi:hypothetical protein